MLEDRYLILGLDGLSRAYQTDYFRDGHRAAAVIAAYYLCREVEMEDGAVNAIRDLINEQWAATDLFASFPQEDPDPTGIGRIIAALERRIPNLRQAGHNVIFPSLALKALRQLPQAVTPSRVDGLCKLVDLFPVTEEVSLEDSDRIPSLGSGFSTAEFVLSELLEFIDTFEGRGQGWSGHLLTYSRALLDLRDMGYGSTVDLGNRAFRLYIKRGHTLLASDLSRPEHPPNDLRPHQEAYWQPRGQEPLGLGHVFKYPYAFYGLMDLARDDDLKRRCNEAAYHVL